VAIGLQSLMRPNLSISALVPNVLTNERLRNTQRFSMKGRGYFRLPPPGRANPGTRGRRPMVLRCCRR